MRRVDTDQRGILNPNAAPAHFRLRRYPPGPGLAGVIDSHWIVEWDLRGRSPHRQEILPHPTVHLVFEPGRALVWGVPADRSVHLLEGAGKAVGTKFRPGGFFPFLGRPVAEITGRTIPLVEAFGPGAEDLAAAVAAAGDDRDQIAVVEEFLHARLPPLDERVALAGRIVALLLEEPELRRVDQLAERVHLSPRSLQRLFRELVGVSPKWVLQRIRLHEAAERMAAGPGADWAALALELGYADQAHFINDFRAYVGRSPAEYAHACAEAARAAA